MWHRNARFVDRTDAGRQLGEQVRVMGLDDPIVLGLPRGGVPVAFEVSNALLAPLDVLVARKIGAPGHPEYGIGAIAEGGGVVYDEAVLATIGISTQRFTTLVEAERGEMQRRVQRYRGERTLAVRDRAVVLVDDGLATGLTAEAALKALRSMKPGRIVLAVPTCPPSVADRLQALADDVVCVMTPSPFVAVGQWYDVFDQTSDDEVISILQLAGH